MQIPSSKEQIKTDCQNQNPKLPHLIKQSKTNTLTQHNYQTQPNRQHQLTDQTNSQIQFLKISKKEQPQKTNFPFSHFSSPLINKKHDQHTPTTKQHTQQKHSKNSDQNKRLKISSHLQQNANHSFTLQRITKTNSTRQQNSTRNHQMIAHKTAISIPRNFIFLLDTTKNKKRMEVSANTIQEFILSAYGPKQLMTIWPDLENSSPPEIAMIKKALSLKFSGQLLTDLFHWEDKAKDARLGQPALTMSHSSSHANGLTNAELRAYSLLKYRNEQSSPAKVRRTQQKEGVSSQQSFAAPPGKGGDSP